MILRTLLSEAGKSTGRIIASLCLACGLSTVATAQEAARTFPDTIKEQTREGGAPEETIERQDIDRFDNALLDPLNQKQQVVDGLVYEPDAIPLSQYRRKLDSSETLVSFSELDISSDGDTKPSYYAAIYSGSTSGAYFKVAAQICDMMRRTYELHRVRCVPLRSQGVGSNIELMKEGRAQMMLVQSNNNWEAQEGINPIAGARSVMSLHDEMGLMVVRRDSDIENVADLRGKRVNIGPEGSASRALWMELLRHYDISREDLDTVYGVAQDYNQQGICEDYIDAFGLWIGHPVPVIEDSLACDAKVVGMGGETTEELVEERPYYFDQVLPAGTYSDQDEEIQSYGFKASLIAYEPADPYVVYWVTRIIHENIETLRAEHPTFRSIEAEDLFEKGNFLPFHPGSACYWGTRADACDWQDRYIPVAHSGDQETGD
ncbi:TAXI family TRAP transporter solute-binding subunit [Fodinicurvata fenggangensis]|uniref:TAXI family TRAP transporter solute-binding subunit n=1 Tax=Fodinicurvata fenggangensis TaxID=1121830 RepID=UPI0006897BE9|nr:TAXI family TRAP transporter solute-binding subunit [Fodinicurvata fenggangensis]